jgi:hypothetical protein
VIGLTELLVIKEGSNGKEGGGKERKKEEKWRKTMYFLSLWNRWQSLSSNFIRSSRAISRVSWIKITDVSGTISIPIIWVPHHHHSLFTFIRNVTCATGTMLLKPSTLKQQLKGAVYRLAIVLHVPNTPGSNCYLETVSAVLYGFTQFFQLNSGVVNVLQWYRNASFHFLQICRSY